MRGLAVRLGVALLAIGGTARAQADEPSAAPPVSEGRAAPKLTRPPKIVKVVEAAFPPEEARSSVVTLALTIDVAGNVKDATVLESGGAAFDAAAVAAARQFTFEPAEVDGRPAAIRIKYTYSFTYVAPASAPAPASASASVPAPAPAPASVPAQDILVHGPARDRDVAQITIAATDARKVVGTQGDPIKVLENLPGLSRPSFGSGQLIVWGSAPEDTRTYVDGVEIPALFHGSALRSTVNGDLVQDVSLTPGAYGPDYGRSLGGIVRVRTRELPTSGVHGYLGGDTLDGSGMVSAAISDRVRIAIAGRYGWLDRVMKAVDAKDVGDYFAIPRYQDYQGKIQVALRARESLDVVVLGSRDDLTRVIPDADPAHARSETTTSAFQRVYLHYTHELGGARVEVTPWIGHDLSKLGASFGEVPAALDQSTWRWGLRGSYRARVTEDAHVTVGADLDGAHASLSRSGSTDIPPREGDVTVFGQPPGNDANGDAWSASNIDVAPYAMLDLDYGPLSISPGLRFDGYLMETSRVTPKTGHAPAVGLSHLEGELEPRVSSRLHVTRALSLVGAAGLYSQPPSMADRSAVFGTPSLGPETGQHASFGESLAITRSLRFDVLGFYKWMSELAQRDPSPTPHLARALLENGVGRSYGVQFLLRQERWHGFMGFVSYTVSHSERRDTPDGTWRLFDYDQPHVLTIVGNQEIGAWTVGARFRYATGLPSTPVIGAFYDSKDDQYQPVFGLQNSGRLPAFWQVDLRVDRSFSLGEGARLLVYLEGLNVSNRSNAEEYVYNVDYSRRSTISGLPIIAVLGARVEL